ncbi:MAG: acyl--CoA ligase, partial [Verrucomicrobiae bacterium]|nr:acyl--CoA ligase [Verrucomicrobiae bacterium]
VPAGRTWTFGELLAESDRAPRPVGPVVFPRGSDSGFVQAVLAGWRHGCCVCPIEAGHQAPDLPAPPAWVAHLKTTSATTGAARWVAFRAAQLAADPAHIVATMGLRPEWPNLGAISLAHSYGFSNLILPLLLHGIPLILAGSGLPEAVRRAAQEAAHLTLAGVPALWEVWRETGAIPKAVRLAISAGAPLSMETEHAVYARHGLKLHNFYGSTECGGIAYDRTGAPRRDPRVVGSALTGVSLTGGRDGCLRVSGPNAGETYWPDPDPALEAGTFQTGDLVEFQNEEILLLGRAGDLINVAGRKVAPATVERVLRAHPAVTDCLVLGMPAAQTGRGESILAIVAAKSVTTAELIAFLRARLPGWQLPKDWWLVPSIPADARGKVSRVEWRRRFLARLESPMPRTA